MPPNQDLQEILRLTKENNHMLHKMRRNALWGGILKFILYAVLFVAAPLWLYATYLGPMMEQVLDTYNQVQGTGAKAKAQFSGIQNVIDQFKNQFSTQP